MTFTVDRNGKHYLSLVSDLPFILCLLSPFSLIRDFGKQNTRGNVSKIFRQSCVLSTDRIEIHQSQLASRDVKKV